MYDQLHKDASVTSQKIQQKRQQRDQDTLKVWVSDQNPEALALGLHLDPSLMCIRLKVHLQLPLQLQSE